jgi:hypothetical protein
VSVVIFVHQRVPLAAGDQPAARGTVIRKAMAGVPIRPTLSINSMLVIEMARPCLSH